MAKERETNLGKYLRSGFEGIDKKCILPTHDDIINSSHYVELFQLYNGLGGITPHIPFGIKSNHIDFYINGNILELDEENHFTRYRLLSLEMPIYINSNILSKENYKKYCLKNESRAQQHAGYWTNDSCEKMFGKAALNGSFSQNGSPRWKQRAFYDTLKDYFSLVSDIKVKRISIYDNIDINGQKQSINEVLKVYNPNYTQSLLSAIKF